MRGNFKQTIKHWLGVIFGATFVYQTECYAQEGEDLIISKLLETKAKGFYIDVGAHHPYRFSNTYLLYKKGWSGISIDPAPGGMSAFQLSRPRDINLEIGIGEKSGSLTYFQFADSAVNTIDETAAKRVIDSGQSKLVNKQRIEVETLGAVTEKWLPKDMSVDFMDIDVEGAELAVLRSNDWQQVQPTVIAVEYLSQDSVAEVLQSELSKYLQKQGYQLQARSVNTLFFKRVA